MKNKIILVVLNCFIFVFLIGNVNAFAVASDYWKGNPLAISPCEKTTVNLRLQNMVGEQDETVRAFLKDGNGIATMKDKNYFLEFGVKGVEVPVNIEIPCDVPLDTKYRVTVTFESVTSGAGGGVALGTGFDTIFDVVVVPEAEVQTSPVFTGQVILWVISAVLIVIVIVLFLLKKKKIFGEENSFEEENKILS